jgi:hypothetical protein
MRRAHEAISFKVQPQPILQSFRLLEEDFFPPRCNKVVHLGLFTRPIQVSTVVAVVGRSRAMVLQPRAVCLELQVLCLVPAPAHFLSEMPEVAMERVHRPSPPLQVSKPSRWLAFNLGRDRSPWRRINGPQGFLVQVNQPACRVSVTSLGLVGGSSFLLALRLQLRGQPQAEVAFLVEVGQANRASRRVPVMLGTFSQTWAGISLLLHVILWLLLRIQTPVGVPVLVEVAPPTTTPVHPEPGSVWQVEKTPMKSLWGWNPLIPPLPIKNPNARKLLAEFA